MNKLCRNLSIWIVAVLFVIGIICGIKIFAKQKEASIYATDISFSTTVGSFEMLVDNMLIIGDDAITITPSNCSFKPRLMLQKENAEDSIIVNNKIRFETSGKYTLYCIVPRNNEYNVSDSITINVVNSITEDTSVYIKKLPSQEIHVGDVLNVEDLVELKGPTSSQIIVSSSDSCAEITDGNIKAIKDGVANLEIFLTYDHITILKQILITISPKVEDSGIDLILSVNNNVLNTLVIEMEYAPYSFAINYELTNLEYNQNINCWTEGDVVEVVLYDSPIIILTPLSAGQTTVYVSPEDYPSIVFEIIVRII